MNGSAERSVRAIKENFVCVSEELRMQGLAICDTETAVGAVLEYVCFMLNSHASIHGSSKTPHEFLSGKNPSVSTRPITSMFGSVVLCELPQSAQGPTTDLGSWREHTCVQNSTVSQDSAL